MSVSGPGVAALVAFLFAFVSVVTVRTIQEPMTQAFAFIFVVRYLRLVVHMCSFWLYRPAPEPPKPRYSERDVTVILPTVDPNNANFLGCLTSCVANRPKNIIIVTAGNVLKDLVRSVVDEWARGRADLDGTGITVTSVSKPSKREQVSHAIKMVHHDNTPFIVLVDDSVVWPSSRLLRQILNAFESDDKVALVGTNKRVRRFYTGSLWVQFWNFIGCIYLVRHNFEIRATNTINGGVFVVSGRTCGLRTSVVQDEDFLNGLKNETCLGQKLLPDDDNYTHRYMVRNGWRVKIQYNDEARIETNLGTYPRFLHQCIRWTRTTWRSNPVSLFKDGRVWSRHPWTAYAAFASSLFNFALVVDPLLVYLLLRSPLYRDSGHPVLLLVGLIVWILASKLVKLIPHFLLHPRDLLFLPAYIAFAYFHSLMKFWALLTFWDVSWSGRKLDKVEEKGGGREE